MQPNSATGSGFISYPEQYDKLHNEKLPDRFILTCTTSFIRGKCDENHHFLKALICGKEWCHECGQKESIIHQRRIARWWSKTFQFNTLGYLVITTPIELRHLYKDKKILSDWRTYIKRKLQRMGYDKGLIRYHWAGDCPYCKGKGCEPCMQTGANSVYNPHLNILIEQGYIEKSDFDIKFSEFKNNIQKWWQRRFPVTIGEAKKNGKEIKANLFFSYARDEAHKVHKLKYITRATWRFYDKEICDIIKGFRTSSTWGKFEKSDHSCTSDLVKLEKNECVCCGGKITWRKEFLNISTFKKINTSHIEGGYYLINDS